MTSYRADKLMIDGHTEAMTIPEGQNWPQVKMEGYFHLKFNNHNIVRLQREICRVIVKHARVFHQALIDIQSTMPFLLPQFQGNIQAIDPAT